MSNGKTPIRDGELLAAVDLGSNSFHMVVARYQHGELRVIDRLRDSVRLAAGLTRDGSLEAERRDRTTRREGVRSNPGAAPSSLRRNLRAR